MTLLWLAAAWLIGVGAAAAGLGAVWPLVAALGAGAAVASWSSARRSAALLAAACALFAILGALWFDAARPDERLLAIESPLAGDQRLTGTVVEEPEERGASQRVRLDVDDGDADVLVTTRPFPRLRYGDRLTVEGKLRALPSGDDDYRDHLTRQGIGSEMLFPRIERTGRGGNPAIRALHDLRRSLGDALEQGLPEPEAALARGILLGQRTSIPRDVSADFNTAGISHLIAVSGFNVTLVAGLGIGALTPVLGRRRAVVASMLLVGLFVVLVGPQPPVIRAGLMGVLMLGAVLAGRPGSGLTAVAAAAALLTLFQPQAIEDVSFQLSFAATAGLLLFARPLGDTLLTLARRVLPDALAQATAELTAVTTAASLSVLPIIAYSFGRVSLVALPANVLAVPAFPVVLVTSALTAAAGLVSPTVGGWFGEAARLPLAYLLRLGEVAADIPAASAAIPRFGPWSVVAMYVLVGVVVIAFLRRRTTAAETVASAPRLGPALYAAALLLAVAGVFAWRSMDGAPAELRVDVLDIGQGDAILVRTPAGHRVLVDGGPSGDRLLRALADVLPAGDRRIDLVVSTHGQDDHVTGLVEVLRRYEVGSVLVSPMPGTSAAFEEWRSELAKRSMPVREAVAGEWSDLGGGVRMQVLGPPARLPRGGIDEVNDASVVLRLVYGDISFLLAGDLGERGEQALLEGGGDLRSTVLKVSHHGSASSTTEPFLAAVRPAVAAVSVGADNGFGHPSATTRLRLAGVPLFRTDENGSVRFETDGSRLRVRVGRGTYEVVQPR